MLQGGAQDFTMMQPHFYPMQQMPLGQMPPEPFPGGNLPPGFDPHACRSVYVGNISLQATDGLLAEIFSSVGPMESCKLIRKDKSSYGFVDYYDHQSAAAALMSLNGRLLLGQPIKVNWAYASKEREDTTGHFKVFVGDLGPEVTDALLFGAFNIFGTCSDARVMWDQKSGRSRGFGFVSFRTQGDAGRMIADMNGKWLGSRQIRCNWATKSAPGDAKSGVTDQAPQTLSTPASTPVGGIGPQVPAPPPQPPGPEGGAEGGAEEHPGGPQYTSVYVGNLSNEVTLLELHRQFAQLNCGAIVDVKINREKGFGFVRYAQHSEAAAAIAAANGRILYGKLIKASWGSKPTPPGLSTTPLPPPPPAAFVGAPMQGDFGPQQYMGFAFRGQAGPMGVGLGDGSMLQPGMGGEMVMGLNPGGMVGLNQGGFAGGYGQLGMAVDMNGMLIGQGIGQLGGLEQMGLGQNPMGQPMGSLGPLEGVGQGQPLGQQFSQMGQQPYFMSG